jgi:hypothetical protein
VVERDEVRCWAGRSDLRDQGSDAFDPPVIEEVHRLSAESQMVLLVSVRCGGIQQPETDGLVWEGGKGIQPTSRMEMAWGDIESDFGVRFFDRYELDFV